MANVTQAGRQAGRQTDRQTPLIDPPFRFYQKLKRLQAEKYLDLRENHLHEKTVLIQKVGIQSSHFKFWIQNLSGDMTKSGSFYFEFDHLCVNG